MKLLFIFLDGVGLGLDEPDINPFARAEMPHLQALLDGKRLLEQTAPYHGERASLLALDACLSVDGLPQSATGQAAILTGLKVPTLLGYHYGPKPNPAVAAYLKNGNLFNQLQQLGRRAVFLNAYPPRYFDGIRSGRRLYSAIPLAVISAGLPLKTEADLRAGQALAADFTAQGWREVLRLTDTPLLTPVEAGERMVELAVQYDLAFFEYWLSDYAGHRQDMAGALSLLATLDEVLNGVVKRWDDEQGLVLITSDHGNLEDLGTRRHTRNPVPAVLIGSPQLRREFCAGLKDLADLTPAIFQLMLR